LGSGIWNLEMRVRLQVWVQAGVTQRSQLLHRKNNLGIQPRVKPLRSPYTGLYPQKYERRFS